MVGVIQKWGNSHAIRLPKTILELALLKENDCVQIIAEENQIIIKKAEPATFKPLNQYLEEYFNKDIETILKEAEESDEDSEEIDWGEPMGREIW
jgi:antitoxin MazE